MNRKYALGFLLSAALLENHAIAHPQNDKNDWVKESPASQKLDAAKLAAMDQKGNVSTSHQRIDRPTWSACF